MASTIQVDKIQDTGGNTILQSDGSGTATTTLPVGFGGTGAATLAGAGLANTPAFLATLGATQSISAATQTKILFDTETFDTDGTFASYKFTPAVTGKYVLYGGLLISGVDDTEYIQLSFYKNGSILTGSIGQTRIYAVAADSSPIITSSVIVESNTTDYFELYGYVSADSGSAEANNRCFFGGNKLIGA